VSGQREFEEPHSGLAPFADVREWRIGHDPEGSLPILGENELDKISDQDSVGPDSVGPNQAILKLSDLEESKNNSR
jgi:hypothetical protein